jgi:hypothetical protein
VNRILRAIHEAVACFNEAHRVGDSRHELSHSKQRTRDLLRRARQTAALESRKETTYSPNSERLLKYIPTEVLAGYIFEGWQTAHFETHSGKVTFLLTLVALCLVAIRIH